MPSPRINRRTSMLCLLGLVATSAVFRPSWPSVDTTQGPRHESLASPSLEDHLDHAGSLIADVTDRDQASSATAAPPPVVATAMTSAMAAPEVASAAPAATATPSVRVTAPAERASNAGLPASSQIGMAPGEDYLYVPASARAVEQATILVALHGVGAEGKGFCRGLLGEAERNGWVVLAPTYRYENWHDPAAVVRDDLSILPRLKAAIAAVPERAGLPVRDKVLIYGFSRGGQVAHRFAMAYPGRVKAVASLGAGTYTLPVTEWRDAGGRRPLALPFGIADLAERVGERSEPNALRQVHFWLGVGGADNRDADVPAAWSPYIGPNRVARAQAFRSMLVDHGVPAALTVFPGHGHVETPEMQRAASAFFRGLPVEAESRPLTRAVNRPAATS